MFCFLTLNINISYPLQFASGEIFFAVIIFKTDARWILIMLDIIGDLFPFKCVYNFSYSESFSGIGIILRANLRIFTKWPANICRIQNPTALSIAFKFKSHYILIRKRQMTILKLATFLRLVFILCIKNKNLYYLIDVRLMTNYLVVAFLNEQEGKLFVW